MVVLRRHGGSSETVVLFGGPRDGEEVVILDASDLPSEIADEVQGGYRLAAGAGRPERDLKGRPVYRWRPPPRLRSGGAEGAP